MRSSALSFEAIVPVFERPRIEDSQNIEGLRTTSWIAS